MPVFLCGLAENLFDCIDLFDCCYYLQLPDAASMERLSRVDRANPLGKSLRHRQLALAMKRELDGKSHAGGLKQLDAMLAPNEIVTLILNDLQYHSLFPPSVPIADLDS